MDVCRDVVSERSRSFESPPPEGALMKVTLRGRSDVGRKKIAQAAAVGSKVIYCRFPRSGEAELESP